MTLTINSNEVKRFMGYYFPFEDTSPEVERIWMDLCELVDVCWYFDYEGFKDKYKYLFTDNDSRLIQPPALEITYPSYLILATRTFYSHIWKEMETNKMLMVESEAIQTIIDNYVSKAKK